MEVRGRIIQKLQPQSGTSAAGRAWKKQEYVLETFDQYPRKVVFTIFGDKVDQMAPQFDNAMSTGADVTVSVDIESRSFVGRDNVERWSTEVRPWKIENTPAVQVPYGDPMAQQYQQPMAQPGFAPQQPQFGATPQPVVPQFPQQPAVGAVQENQGTDDLPF